MAVLAYAERLRRALAANPAVVAIYVVMAVVFVLFIWATPQPLTVSRATGVLAQRLPLVLVAIGQTVVILARGIDLSVGGVVSLTNVLGATLIADEALGLPVGVAVVLATGTLVGLGNGLLVAYGRMPSIIVTLATWSILRGVALYIMPRPGGGVPTTFANFPLQAVGWFPLPLLLIVGIPLALWLPFRRSRAGHALLAVGGDQRAAFESGVAVRRSRVIAFTYCGFFAGLGGLFMTMQAASGDARIGDTFALTSIAAVALGGTLLSGGRGGVAGSIAGALVLGMLASLLFFLGVSVAWQFVVSGTILIAAVSFGAWATGREARSQA